MSNDTPKIWNFHTLHRARSVRSN